MLPAPGSEENIIRWIQRGRIRAGGHKNIATRKMSSGTGEIETMEEPPRDDPGDMLYLVREPTLGRWPSSILPSYCGQVGPTNFGDAAAAEPGAAVMRSISGGGRRERR